jgi:hypothetical protein
MVINDIKNQLRNKINEALSSGRDNIEQKLEKLKKSFGTIQSEVYLSAEDLRREILYDDGR